MSKARAGRRSFGGLIVLLLIIGPGCTQDQGGTESSQGPNTTATPWEQFERPQSWHGTASDAFVFVAKSQNRTGNATLDYKLRLDWDDPGNDALVPVVAGPAGVDATATFVIGPQGFVQANGQKFVAENGRLPLGARGVALVFGVFAAPSAWTLTLNLSMSNPSEWEMEFADVVRDAVTWLPSKSPAGAIAWQIHEDIPTDSWVLVGRRGSNIQESTYIEHINVTLPSGANWAGPAIATPTARNGVFANNYGGYSPQAGVLDAFLVAPMRGPPGLQAVALQCACLASLPLGYEGSPF